jgi:hypothetical protein
MQKGKEEQQGVVGVVGPVAGLALGRAVQVEMEWCRRGVQREAARGVGLGGLGGGQEFGVEADCVAQGGAEQDTGYAVVEGGQ